MNGMQVPNLIRQIPDHLSHALIYTIKKWAEITERITQYWETKRTEFAQSNFWKEYKPLYKRTIEPLNKTDYLILTGSFSSAVLLTATAVNIYSVAILPLAAGVGTLLFAGACHFSIYRVHKHFNKIAWRHIDRIRRTAHGISPTNPNFQTIAAKRSALDQPKFSHLKDDLKNIDDEIEHFRKVFITPERKDQTPILADAKQAFKNYLEGFQRKLAPHRPIQKIDGPEEEEEKKK